MAHATDADAAEMLQCVNAAYMVETGTDGLAFKKGTRYGGIAQVSADIAKAAASEVHPQQFLVARRRPSVDGAVDGAAVGEVVGCIRAEILKDTATGEPYCEFGPFAVSPTAQREGIGSALVDKVAEFARAHHAVRFEIGVVNHRSDGLAWYGKQGFVTAGTKPFADAFHVANLTRPCHFIIMTKALV